VSAILLGKALFRCLIDRVIVFLPVQSPSSRLGAHVSGILPRQVLSRLLDACVRATLLRRAHSTRLGTPESAILHSKAFVGVLVFGREQRCSEKLLLCVLVLMEVLPAVLVLV
jgi:hypothetical protein